MKSTFTDGHEGLRTVFIEIITQKYYNGIHQQLLGCIILFSYTYGKKKSKCLFFLDEEFEVVVVLAS